MMHISGKLKQIVSLGPENFDFLKAANNNDSYQLSPTYYLFTGRKGLWVLEQDGQAALIAKHPNLEDELLVFYPNGYCPNLEHQVLHHVPRNSRLKAARLAVCANSNLNAVMDEELFLDWRYPVCILDTAYVGKLRGRLLEDVKNNYNRAARTICRIEAYNPAAHKDRMRELIQQWHRPEAHDGYEGLLNIMERMPGNFGLIALTEESIAGFIHWEMPWKPGSPANSLALIVDKSIKGLSEFMMVEMCRALVQTGCLAVNIGGSETESLHYFKSKFNPKMVDLRNYNYA